MQIMNLRREREAKAKEFAEVKDLSSRLMEVMGIDLTRTATQSPHQNRRSSKSSIRQTEHRNLDVTSAADPKESLTPSVASRLGSSTKRTKTLRSPRSSVARLTNPSTPSWEYGGDMITKKSRSPLKEMGINHPPSKEIAAIPFPPLLRMCGELRNLDPNEPGKENEENDINQGEYKRSFGASDIFTSTDSHQYSENIERFTTGQCDDTTIDF